jgi:hypothetical protein
MDPGAGARRAPAGPREPLFPPARLAGAAAACWAVLALDAYLAHHDANWLSHKFLAATTAPLLSLSWRGCLAPLLPALLAAAVTAAVALAAWRPGLALVRWLAPRARPAEARQWFALIAGLGLLGLLAWGAGLCGFFSAGSYAALLSAAAVPALPRLPSLARAAAARARAAPRPSLWLAAGLAGAALAQATWLFAGFTPPHVSDELIYHLGSADRYLEAGRIHAVPHLMHAAWPQLDTMLYGAALAFGLTFGVKWLHGLAGLLALWGLRLLLRDEAADARRAGLLMFATIPVVWVMAGRAYNDLFLCLYGAGVFIAAGERALGGPARRALLAGVCVGLAGGHKYSGLLLGAALPPFLHRRALAPAAAAAAAAAAPWLIRNWLELGNPVHPFLWKAFGDPHWDAHLEWRVRTELLRGDVTALQHLAHLPALLWDMPVRNFGSGPDGTTGPWLAMGLPWLFLACRRPEGLAIGAVALPILLSGATVRLLLPIFVPVCAVLSRVPGRLLRLPSLRGPVRAAAAALAVFQGLETVRASWAEYDAPLPVTFGQESREAYLARTLYPPLYYPPGLFRLLHAADERLPSGARVLFIGGVGGGWLMPRPCRFTPLEGRPLPIRLARVSRNADHLARKFRQLGITHVAVNRVHNDIFFDFWKLWDWKDGAELQRWIRCWDERAVPLWRWSESFALYAFSPRPLRQPHQLTPGLEDEGVKLLSSMIRKRDWAAARPFLQIMAGLFPGHPGVWVRATELNALQGLLREAEATCAEVRRLAPGGWEADQCRAAILAAQGRDREAAEVLHRVARRRAFDPQVWADLAAVAERAGLEALAARAKWQSLYQREFRPERW